jgi:hypothetical protein
MTVKKPAKAKKVPTRKNKPGAGRKSIYTKALTAKICKQLADGKSLRSICAQAGMPDKSTVLMWIVDGEHKEFSEQYKLAREAAGYSHADRIIDTIDKVEQELISHSAGRVVVEGLKWAAERMAPKSHAPRAQISGPDEKPLMPTNEPLNEDQLQEELSKRGLPTILFDQ